MDPTCDAKKIFCAYGVETSELLRNRKPVTSSSDIVERKWRDCVRNSRLLCHVWIGADTSDSTRTTGAIRR